MEVNLKVYITGFTIALILLVLLSLFKSEKDYLSLGSSGSKKIFVYLCGLTHDFYSAQEEHNREILDTLGKKLNIQILALKPSVRCPQYHNMLCWPHDTEEEVMETYASIENRVAMKSIAGFIGFSNGAFFLTKIAQIKKLTIPMIAIAGAAYLTNATEDNTMYLLVGKQDQHHYKLVHQFYDLSQGTSLHVSLIEHEGAHTIPIELLEKILKEI